MVLTMTGEGKILLRKSDDIREWYNAIKVRKLKLLGTFDSKLHQDCVRLSKERLGKMKTTEEFWSRRDTEENDEWPVKIDKERLENKDRVELGVGLEIDGVVMKEEMRDGDSGVDSIEDRDGGEVRDVKEKPNTFYQRRIEASEKIKTKINQDNGRFLKSCC